MLRFESFDSRYMVRCVVFRLKLTNVTLRDAGLYTCEGFNTFGRQLTTGQLIVRRGMSTLDRNCYSEASSDSTIRVHQFFSIQQIIKISGKGRHYTAR